MRCAYVIFPSSNNKTGIEGVLFTISKFIEKKFPVNTIKYTMIDTKDKMKNFYKNLTTATGSDVTNKVEEMRKLPRPHFYIGYTYNNFDTDESGLGLFPLYTYPAQYFDNTMKSYLPIFNDKQRNIEIRSTNVRIKIEGEGVITCQSKEEQVSIYSYIMNFIKIHNGYRLGGIRTEYLLPASCIRSLKNIIFGKNVNMSDVSDKLDEYLVLNSADMIHPRFRNGKKEDKFIALEYIYDSVYFQLTNKPSMDEGEKKGDVYENFLIRFPFIVEMYIPLNYILKVPELVQGLDNVTQVGDFVFMSADSDENGEGQVRTFIKEEDPTLPKSQPFIDPDRYELIHYEDFLLEAPTDYVKLRDWLPDDDKKFYDSITPDERKELYKAYFYENEVVREYGKDVVMSDDLVATITNGSLNKSQCIEIYRDKYLYKSIKNSKS